MDTTVKAIKLKVTPRWASSPQPGRGEEIMREPRLMSCHPCEAVRQSL